MEPEAEPSKRDDSRSADLSSDSDSDIETPTTQAETPQVEWLATGRQRRSTAGNRMKSMLANEEPDSDLELLFAEDEDDQGFTDVDEAGSDVHMDSSSDDDDENNAADDLEGEKELERQAKEKRAAQRKRKAQEAIPAKFRKKVRIDPTTRSTPSAPAPRPKKKSERTSWLPSAADLPTRASSRQTTRLSKEQLHQQMIEREERRLKQLDQMAKKAAKLEAMKKPPMTQEERLREAAIVEKRNSKSLNRWEVAEKQREEERRAKLAALNNRTLKGPVITFWSGLRESTDGMATHMGMMVVEEKVKKKEKKVKEKGKGKGADDKAASAEPKTAPGESTSTSAKPEIQPSPQIQPPQPNTTEATPTAPLASPSPTVVKVDTPSEQTAEAIPKTEPPQTPAHAGDPPRLMAMPPPPPRTPSPSGLAAPAPAPTSTATEPPRAVLTPPPGMTRPPETKPSGVLAAPVLAPPPSISINGGPPPVLGFGAGNPKSNVLAPPDTAQLSGPPNLKNTPDRPVNAGLASSQNAITSAPLPAGGPTPTSTSTAPQPSKDTNLQSVGNHPVALIKAGSVTPSEPLSEPPSEPPPPEILACNTIIFQNFNENAIKDRNIQTQILFNRKMTRLAKPSAPPLCVITNHPARYRDPKTGLPYYNAYAYREIQRLRKGDYHWSKLLGAWVGSGTYAARGVPERFLHPGKESPNKKRIEEEKKRLEEEKKKAEEEKEKPKEEKEKQIENGEKNEEEAKPPVDPGKSEATVAEAAEAAKLEPPKLDPNPTKTEEVQTPAVPAAT